MELENIVANTVYLKVIFLVPTSAIAIANTIATLCQDSRLT